MKRTILLAAVAALFASALAAQQPAAPPVAEAPPVDPIGQQAAALEVELGKFKDTSPEAAEAMVKLVDLYHADGRLFGLVRVGQQFVAAHPADSRHQAVMLKLIDGQEALSRNKELSATIRQFLARYPQAAECAPLEVRLAEALLQQEDRLRAAEACQAVWQRQGANEIGRRYGAAGVPVFSAIGSGESIALAAALGEDMLDKLPPGDFARQVGHQAFYEYRRISQWAKSNGVGAKLFAKGLAGDAETQRQLHVWMAENQANQGQFANAAQSLRQARAIRDDQYVHYLLLNRLYNGGAKPPEIEPLANEYLSKYPTRPDRFHGISWLAISCVQNGEKPRAANLFASLLAEDPVFNGNASYFVQNNGSEAANFADSEAKLLAAVAQNKPGVHYLRYVLALEVYRDRLQQPAKAKQIARELISQSPTDDGHTSGPLEWLLNNPIDDNEFKSDLALILAARQKNPHLANFREMVKNWAGAARQNKDLVARANLALEALKTANADPVLTMFVDQRNNQHAPGEAIRNKLLEPAIFNTLSDGAARYVLQTQAEWFRHYSPGAKRGEQVRVYQQFCQRFPQDTQAGWYWLETAVDYGKPEEMKAAAENYLKFPPEASVADAWRRLMIVAEKNNNDQTIARNSWNWMQQAQQKFGPDPTYATNIGDQLLKFGLEAEAVQHWTTYMTANRNHYESRDCASRLLARIMEPPQRIAFIQAMLAPDTDFYGRYSQWLADEHLKLGDVANFEAVLKAGRAKQVERPMKYADWDLWQVASWFDAIRGN
ncbi:MAG TPA: hypothetical protein VFV87_13690, partial [Pirellulaceae bacterium]|nr:hypothetical protein [Pirellulaceae bacterium]